MDRRQTLLVLGGAGASLVTVGNGPDSVLAQTAFDCILNPEMTEGPYWVDEKLNRSDIRIDPSNGTVSAGLPLELTINVYSVRTGACAQLPGAYVDVWHCDAGGLYSDVSANSTVGRKFLRGYQITGETGVAKFQTIYPGWYRGRAVHIHLRVRTYSGTTVTGTFTSQLHFDDTISDQVLSVAPYNTRGTRDTRNSNDMVYTGAGSAASRTLITLTRTTDGYAATINVGVNLTATAASRPTITSGGIVSAATGVLAGVVPGSWVTIYGTNLASVAREITTADIVSDRLPTTLSGVSVQINGKAAFIRYVDPNQVNVQPASDTSTGSVNVTVANAAGTSDARSATMQAIQPAFFVSGNYVAARRNSDAVVINASTPAKPGEVLQLYGTGFGPTNPSVEAGVVFQAAYATTNTVTVTIGGVAATVAFAGLSAPGLYQFNVTVPQLANGDHAVVATVSGQTTQSGVLLRVQA
ncbi:MAG: hypothetical protein SFV18_03795 [Bryobacteraceae bacterium]|nr:hypothetical protein [Bryobacteraceae bacterium]